MNSHPFVTVYRSEDGTWKATWTEPATKRLLRMTFRKAGILTAEARRAWAIEKSAALLAERLARAAV